MPRPSPALFVLAAALLAPALSGCVDSTTERRVRANAFLRGGDAAAALKECDDGLARKKDVSLLILRGKALFELDRLDDARSSYRSALDEGSQHEPRALAEARLGLAMVASRKGDWKEAKSEFMSLVAINDKDATSHLNVAKACLELKDVACAIEHGEQAGRLRGNEESVLFSLGSIYLAADKPAEAEKTFQHICEVSPGASSCPYGVALVAAKAGEKAKAIEELKKAVDRKLPNPDRIAKDTGFASLREEAEFKALVARAAEPTKK